MASHTTRRRTRCDLCDRLYHTTDEHPVSGACPRCWSLVTRLERTLPRPIDRTDHDARRAWVLDLKTRARAIVTDPAGPEAASLIDIERVLASMDEMTPTNRAYFVAYLKQETKAYQRARLSVVR